MSRPREVAEFLKLGTAELAIAGPLGESWSRLEIFPLFEEPFGLVVSRPHRLAGRDKAELKDLASETLLINSGCDMVEELRACLVTNGILGTAIHQVATQEDLMELLKADLGVAIIPVAAVQTNRLCRIALKDLNLVRRVQSGESDAYEQLLRELDAWLLRYFARRLPRPAAEDARQEALLAIHANRHAYVPSRSFGAWVTAIARYKWIDRVREAYRVAALSLHGEKPIEDQAEAAINTIVLHDLLKRLKPAQARVIRLVTLQGASIEDASGATGQPAALVKVNIHRGLKKLPALAAGDTVTPMRAADSSMPRNISSNLDQSTGFSVHQLANPAAHE